MINFPRVKQKIFASNSGANGTTEYGSTASGSTNYTKDLATIMNDNWETGITSGVVSGKCPVLQDDNAIRLVITTQLSYLLQKGVPAWNNETTYYIGDCVREVVNNKPTFFYSTINNNLNNDPKQDTTNWRDYLLEIQNACKLPSGTIQMYAGNTIPTGWLLCNGASLVRSSYTELFNAIGTIYGAVDTEHFNLPNLINRYVKGGTPGTYGNPSLPTPTHTHTRGDMNISGSIGYFDSGDGGDGSGCFQGSSKNYGFAGLGTSAHYGTTINFNANKNWSGNTSQPNGLPSIYQNGAEVNPYNLSLNYIIKY